MQQIKKKTKRFNWIFASKRAPFPEGEVGSCRRCNLQHLSILPVTVILNSKDSKDPKVYSAEWSWVRNLLGVKHATLYADRGSWGASGCSNTILLKESAEELAVLAYKVRMKKFQTVIFLSLVPIRMLSLIFIFLAADTKFSEILIFFYSVLVNLAVDSGSGHIEDDRC